MDGNYIPNSQEIANPFLQRGWYRFDPVFRPETLEFEEQWVLVKCASVRQYYYEPDTSATLWVTEPLPDVPVTRFGPTRLAADNLAARYTRVELHRYHHDPSGKQLQGFEYDDVLYLCFLTAPPPAAPPDDTPPER